MPNTEKVLAIISVQGRDQKGVVRQFATFRRRQRHQYRRHGASVVHAHFCHGYARGYPRYDRHAG